MQKDGTSLNDEHINNSIICDIFAFLVNQVAFIRGA